MLPIQQPLAKIHKTGESKEFKSEFNGLIMLMNFA